MFTNQKRGNTMSAWNVNPMRYVALRPIRSARKPAVRVETNHMAEATVAARSTSVRSILRFPVA
jgi:hypothetical protein